jgi:Replication initiator protein, pSAM2
MTTAPTRPPDRTTRADRMAQPTTRDAVRAVAENHGACLRPIQLRRTNTDTGEVDQVLIPCGATRADVCPPCASRAKELRAAQCREGWHLDTEPITDPPPPDEVQAMWVEHRAQAQADRDHAAQAGEDTAELDELIGELDHEIKRSGLRGNADPGRPRPRRQRSTRRRQDAPDPPKRKIAPHTIGKTYTAPDGKTFRPSMFITLTCPSYGKVGEDGTPTAPGSYDYPRAARDALHFAALFDRFIQNLRRVLGYDVQYFATIEPQKRLAPHVHIAIRGTVSRAELRQIIAATYHQVWWPATHEVRFEADRLPVWDEARGRYLDPQTGELLSEWDAALNVSPSARSPSCWARLSGSRVALSLSGVSGSCGSAATSVSPSPRCWSSSLPGWSSR